MREKDYFISQVASGVVNRFYVYLHRKASDGCTFYVGKGSSGRAWVVSDRNKKWTNIYKKHGIIVEILAKNLSEQEAFDMEIQTIAALRDSGLGTLCNFTDGGEGASGYRHSAESREVFSNRMKIAYNKDMAAKMAEGVREYYRHNVCIKDFSGKPWSHPNARLDVWSNFTLIFTYYKLGLFSKEIFPSVSLWNMIDHIDNGLTPDNPEYVQFKESLDSQPLIEEFPLKALKYYTELYSQLPEICRLVRAGQGYVKVSEKLGIPRARLRRLVSNIKKDSNFEIKLKFIKERLDYGTNQAES